MPASAKYIEDITIPDDTPILAGSSFTKTWLVENNGDVPWGAGFSLIFKEGLPMTSVTRVPLPVCSPGTHVSVSVAMTAPVNPGTVKSVWAFQDSQGNLFGDTVFAQILVKALPANAVSTSQNNSMFVADITIPDNTEMKAGSQFVKTWRVRNTGTTTWEAHYKLVMIGGNLNKKETSLPAPTATPGMEVDLSVKFTTPQTPGTYNSEWKLQDPQGNLFGDKFFVIIVVKGAAAAAGTGTTSTTGGTATTPATPAPEIKVQVPAIHYSQRDSRWANTHLGNLGQAPTIKMWGCMMTTFAMTATYFGKTVTPLELNNLMVQRNGFVNGYFTRWEALQNVFGFPFLGKTDQTGDMISRIDQHLNAGMPVPVMVDQTPQNAYSDADQHWVLLVGRKDNNDYWMNDPWELEATPKSLMARYGRPGGTVGNSIMSAIFYRKV